MSELDIDRPTILPVERKSRMAAGKRYVSRVWHGLGPGLITGAADDDPSGIATSTQVGVQYGYAIGWTMLYAIH